MGTGYPCIGFIKLIDIWDLDSTNSTLRLFGNLGFTLDVGSKETNSNNICKMKSLLTVLWEQGTLERDKSSILELILGVA